MADIGGWVIVDGKRYDLNKMTDLKLVGRIGDRIEICGVFLTGSEPTKKRALVLTLVNGKSVGHWAKPEEVAALANNFRCDALAALVPEGEY